MNNDTVSFHHRVCFLLALTRTQYDHPDYQTISLARTPSSSNATRGIWQRTKAPNWIALRAPAHAHNGWVGEQGIIHANCKTQRREDGNISQQLAHLQYSAFTAAKCLMSRRYKCTKQTSFIDRTPALIRALRANARQEAACITNACKPGPHRAHQDKGGIKIGQRT